MLIISPVYFEFIIRQLGFALTLLLFPSVLMLQHFTLTLLRNIQYQCKNSPVSKNDEIQSSHHRATPPPLCWLDVCSQDVGRASSLRCCGLARLWVVTSCSILFLCRCASALRPPGLTLHCSSNNCCGTPNICKPPLLLTQLPLCWAAVCVCVYFQHSLWGYVQHILWCWSYLVRVVCHCVRVCTARHCNGDFLMLPRDCES